MIQSKSRKHYELTEPSPIRLDPRVGQFLGLILVAEDFTAGGSLGPGFVHLEAANCGGGTPFGGFLLPIGAVGVEGVFWFAGDVSFPLRLPHL